MDNPNWTGNPDRDRINLHEDWEVRYWTHKWSISEEQLKAAKANADSSLVRKIHNSLVELGYMEEQLPKREI